MVPPLRERTEDIMLLVEYFINKLARKLDLPGLHMDVSCLDYFQSYAWPGNARELQNALERAAVLSGDGVIRAEHLPPEILSRGAVTARFNTSAPQTLAEIELDYIRTILQLTGGNRARAAKILGIGQSTLWRKLKNKSYEAVGATIKKDSRDN